MRTRICFSIGLVVGLLMLGVRGYPAEGPAADSRGRRAGRRTTEPGDQRGRRSDSFVREPGALQSADTLEICSEIEGPTTILRIVPEGSTVKRGDLLVELDASWLRDKQLQHEVVLAEARGALVQAETALAALKELASGRVAVAELALKVAELDRQRFLGEGGEFELEMRKIDSHVAVAEKRVQLAQMVLAQVEKAVEEGRAEKKNLEEASLAVFESRVQLETAQASKQLFTKHARDYRTAALELAIGQAKSTLSEIKIESRVGLQRAEAKAFARKAAVQLEEKRLARIQQQIEKCRIVAPRDGEVMYASVAASPRTAPVVIEQGAMVRQRQPILRMPDMSRLEVRVRVPESRVDRVREGQPATIRIDAFPDREFRGKVAQVSDVPEPTSFFSGGVKEYAVVVSIEDPTPELRPGMTALVEIDVSGSDRE